MTIGTVVFDLGGVLIEWDPRHLYRQLLPDDEVEGFLEEIGFAEWNHRQDAGRAWSDAVEEHIRRHPHRADLIRAYPERFGDSLVGPIPGTVAILEELHTRGVPLLALTNWSAESFPVARDGFPFLDLFDDIVVSGEERVAKPDPRIFRILVERHGLEPAATMFIDDSPANVEAASAVGLVAVRYESPAALRAQLVAAGLLPPDGSVSPSGAG
ncbi:MAG: 2-haloacid dehalogenase [Actinomycetota bacterium]|jgi:2-haloacid dehalogenase|nr:2-haloacid dehalogenase [Actinomycetota bacterium]